MSTHNICFHQEIRNILCGYPLLSVAMFNGIDKQCGHRSDCCFWSSLIRVYTVCLSTKYFKK